MEYGALLSPLSSVSQRKLFFPVYFSGWRNRFFRITNNVQNSIQARFEDFSSFSILLFVYLFLLFDIFQITQTSSAFFQALLRLQCALWYTPSKTPPGSFSPNLSPPTLKSANCPSPLPLFRQFSPYLLVFRESPSPKNWIFQ